MKFFLSIAFIFVLQNLASVNEVTLLMLYPKMPAQSSSKLPLTCHFVPRPFFPVELRVTAPLTFFSAQHRVAHVWLLTWIPSDVRIHVQWWKSSCMAVSECVCHLLKVLSNSIVTESAICPSSLVFIIVRKKERSVGGREWGRKKGGKEGRSPWACPTPSEDRLQH